MRQAVLERKIDQIVRFLEKQYDLEVQLLDNSSFTIATQVAEWKNSRLVVDVRERGAMGTLFVICHVFGHLVQYSTTRKYNDMLAVVESRPLPLDLDENFKNRYFVYEKEACQIGKGLMERVFCVDEELDRLYQLFMYADYDHYWNYLVTGRGSSREEFNEILRKTKRGRQKDLRSPLQSISPPDRLALSGSVQIIVV